MSSVSIPTLKSSAITCEAISSASTPSDFFEVIPSGPLASGTGDGTVYTIVYATEIYDEGSNFATSTFTAPTAGYYHFDLNVNATLLDNAPSLAILAIVCSTAGSYSSTLGNVPVDELNMNKSITVLLAAAETVTTTIAITGCTATPVQIEITSSFSGYRIST